MPDIEAEDAALLRRAAAVVRRYRVAGVSGRFPGWDSVAKTLDRMAELLVSGQTSDLPEAQLGAAWYAVREHPGDTAAKIGERIGEHRELTLNLLTELERRRLVTRKEGQAATWWFPRDIRPA